MRNNRWILGLLVALLVLLPLTACQGEFAGRTGAQNGLASVLGEDPPEDEGEAEGDLPEEQNEADPEEALEAESEAEEAQGGPPGGSARCAQGSQPNTEAERLAAELGVPVDDVLLWFCAGYGFGEIQTAYLLAEASGLDIEEVFALREGGRGWGVIAQQLGVVLDDDDPDEDGQDRAGTNRCEAGVDPNPAAVMLAGRLGVDVEDIQAWFCQGYGLGEVRLAYQLAEAADDTTVEEVFALRASGLGWGVIRQQLGLQPGGGPPDDVPGGGPPRIPLPGQGEEEDGDQGRGGRPVHPLGGPPGLANR